jgi:HK97 family phage portal protein
MFSIRERFRRWAAVQLRGVLGSENFLKNIIERTYSSSGENVTADTALTVAAVYACVRVLSETVASLPLFIYQARKDGGKDSVRQHPLWDLLHNKPNQDQTAYEFFEQGMAHLNLRGNAFSQKIREASGRIVELIPQDPSMVKVERGEDGRLIYKITGADGREKTFKQQEIWHVRGLSTDGIIGLSPIQQAREAIGISMAADKYGGRFFRNSARPSGYLKHPGTLKETARASLAESWQASYGGENASSTAVLEEGLEYHALSISNEDAQFLESRQFQIEEIARIFRVPCVLIGHPDNTSTYASAEQFFLSFVVHTIRPWVTRIEKSINVNLVSEDDRKKGIFAEFKLDGLLRGDTASRYQAYALAIQNKIMNPNEVRSLENMNPYPGGEVYENPNVKPANGGNDEQTDE